MQDQFRIAERRFAILLILPDLSNMLPLRNFRLINHKVVDRMRSTFASCRWSSWSEMWLATCSVFNGVNESAPKLWSVDELVREKCLVVKKSRNLVSTFLKKIITPKSRKRLAIVRLHFRKQPIKLTTCLIGSIRNPLSYSTQPKMFQFITR